MAIVAILVFDIYFSVIDVGKMRVQVDLSQDGNSNRNLLFIETKYDVKLQISLIR